MWHTCALLLAVLSACTFSESCRAAEPNFDLQTTEQGISVLLNGQLFTRYLIESGTKPILWPIIGPDGQAMTRAFPMAEPQAHEKADHPHHRSLWFTHGDVNGISFWEEPNWKQPKPGKIGLIVHREFGPVEGGSRGSLVAISDWVVAEVKGNAETNAKPNFEIDPLPPLIHDRREIRFSVVGESRVIDFDITLTAGDTPVKFGDTKEGSFGMRVSGPATVDEKLGGKIVNREGLTDAAAWGKRSAWVDYQGPAIEKGPTYGIAILHHPTSFRFPTYWHVRTYGLFAANPFGAHNFENSNEIDGTFELAPRESFRHRYRIVLHRGDHVAAKIETLYGEYTQLP